MDIKLRKDRMTADERWIALLNRQPLDRIPVYGFASGFSAIHCGFTIGEYYNSPEKAYYAVKRTAAEFGWQDIPRIAYAAIASTNKASTKTDPTIAFTNFPTGTHSEYTILA